MRVAGATIVRNAVRLHYPIIAAIRSIQPLVDVVTVNVGQSDDGTLEMLSREFDGESVNVMSRHWDSRKGGAVLADETNIACQAVPADWVVYVQADEVLHESGTGALRHAMAGSLNDPEVEGLLVTFVHHYARADMVATARTWYRQETRVIRAGAGISSYHEAQGFRVSGRRVRARASGAVYHHYGWARPARALLEKAREDFGIYGRKTPRPQETLPWEVGLKRFEGQHPAAVLEWLDSCAGVTPGIGPKRWDRRQLRLAFSAAVEAVTGKRLWEYRNYREV